MSSHVARTADVIVVGAGLSGSWVAKELTAKGMTVALLDAGSLLDHNMLSAASGRRTIFNPRYHLFRMKLLLRGQTDRALNRFISSESSKLFLDRRTDPYTTPSNKEFSWLRVRAVGGRGHLWGRVMLRLTDQQLSAPASEWPVTYQELCPYYSEVERLLELGGAPSQTIQVPDGEYVHSRSLNVIEEQFKASVTERWPLRPMVVNHVAHYEPAPFSPMLRLAFETGRLRLFPGKVVDKLAHERARARIVGVTAICAATGAKEFYRAPIVVLAASAFETIRILLNSRSTTFPHGVGNQNGLLGTRILEHIMVNFFGELPKSIRTKTPSYWHNPFKLNAEPHGFFIPPFSHREGTASGYQRDYGIQGTMSQHTGLVYLGAFGETLPRDTNRLTLDSSRTDRFGIPLASIDFVWDNEDLMLRRHAAEALAEMIEAFCKDSKISLIHPFMNRLYQALMTNESIIPGSNHECGGARMGSDPRSSVTDPFNRLWEAPNVLVCDSACFPTIPHQNPTLTTMALALRAARRLAAKT